MARVTMLLDNDFTRDGRVRKEAATLAGAGHDVTIVALAGEGCAPEERVGDVAVVRVPPASFHAWRGPARAWTILRWYDRMAPLGRAAEAIPADVVHAHDLPTLKPALRAARRLGAALVFDDHELYVETLDTTWPSSARGLRRFVYRAAEARIRAAGERLCRRAAADLDGVIAVSGPLAAEYHRRYGGPEPVVVANCPPRKPAPAPDGRLRAAAGVGEDTRVVLFVGTFPVEGIGLEDAIDALAGLPEDVVLAFVGWGSGRDRLAARAEARGLSGRLRWLGPVPPEELPGWYADADVSLVPNVPGNLSNLHGLPNKLFESMMAGVPVVVADSPGMAAVLEDYPAGVTYRMGDAEDLAARVREVLDAPAERREEWRREGRRAVTERWSWERQAAVLLRLYEAVIAATPRRK